MTDAMLIEDEDIASRLRAVELQHRHPRRLYTPFVEAADEYEAWLSHPEDRVYTGVAALDDAMRGIGPGEMMMVTGASHSGKSLLASEAIIFNRTRPTVLITPDETRSLVAVKLTCALTGVSAKEIEERVSNGDVAAKRLVRETITNEFPRLAVTEDNLTVTEMHKYMDEVSDAWGERPVLVVYDYLDLLNGVDTVPAAATALKGFGKHERVAQIVIHQASRTAGADGRKLTIHSGAYGGEQQATFLVGVRRKRDEIKAKILAIDEALEGLSVSDVKADRLGRLRAELEWDLQQHQETMTVSLVKSKRPPCDLVDDIDFRLDKRTGRLFPFDPSVPANNRANLPTGYAE